MLFFFFRLCGIVSDVLLLSGGVLDLDIRAEYYLSSLQYIMVMVQVT